VITAVVTNRPQNSRFEIAMDGRLAGYLNERLGPEHEP
jgi:hypothetical protein